jgi:hypothetical protein
VSALTILTTVGANEGPWVSVSGGLNSAYPYDTGGYTPPTVISASQGFNFSAGLSLTVSYVSGLVRIGDTQWPFVDANGVPGLNPLGYGLTPANYMNPALGPYSMSELVGTFANSSGSIVGTPFAIGNLGTFTIPTGATQLQLGVMDFGYGDNLGSWTIQVSQVPEPATWSLLALGAIVLIGSRRLRSSL